MRRNYRSIIFISRIDDALLYGVVYAARLELGVLRECSCFWKTFPGSFSELGIWTPYEPKGQTDYAR